MGASSILPVIVTFALALITAGVLARLVGIEPGQRRLASIDGLRGYLALSVFLHHARFLYFYIVTGNWDVPPSHLYSHLGRASVLLFFMVTAFLFMTKLIDGRRSGLDWLRLVVSRLLRIMPLYFVAMLLVVLLVFHMSHWTAEYSPAVLAGQIGRWLAFLHPPINGIDDTSLIDCGVTWTLPYEWSFYFALPILGLLIGARTPTAYIVLSAVAVVAGYLFWPLYGIYGLAFLGGGVAAYVVRFEFFRRIARTRAASVVALGILAFTGVSYLSPTGTVPIALLSVFFCIVAGGNDLFGMLATTAARLLGQISYSLYLLHGTLLYALFVVFIKPDPATWTPLAHWTIALALVPVMVAFCLGTFLAIEKPGMAMTGPATRRLRRLGRHFGWIKFAGDAPVALPKI
jgi:peptidoglycan/LPS O-acetylase OafA/YrhL